MSVNFRRVYKLEIGDDGELMTIDGFQQNPLQIAFTIEQTPNIQRSYAEITIFGLSRESRAKIREEYTQIRLVAGFADNYGQIFKGFIRNVEPGRSGAEQYLRLYCESGNAPAEIIRSWGPNTPRIEIIRDIAESFRFPVEIVGDFSHLPPAVKGFALFKERKLAMDEQAEIWGFEWMIKDQTVYVVAPGATIPDTEYRVSATTGMIASPTMTTVGADVSLKMVHSLRPWAVFRLESETGSFNFNGIYFQKYPATVGEGRFQITSMQIQGDFYGNAWDMELQGRRL